MSGEVVHFEIPSDDVERARTFYRKTFGWKMDPVPGLEYTRVTTRKPVDGGRTNPRSSIDGGILLRQPRVQSPSITIRVDDINRFARTIEKNGGKMVEPKSPIGDGSVGFAGYFTDTEGNLIGLFQPIRR